MSSNDPLGYYRIFDLTPAATDAEIKVNYRERAKLWHPDHNTSEEATEKFQQLSVASGTTDTDAYLERRQNPPVV